MQPRTLPENYGPDGKMTEEGFLRALNEFMWRRQDEGNHHGNQVEPSAVAVGAAPAQAQAPAPAVIKFTETEVDNKHQQDKK